MPVSCSERPALEAQRAVLSQRAIYVRTSPTREPDGRAQLFELENAAKARGWTDYRIFTDLDESGARDSRPQWNQLRTEIRAGRIAEVMATEIARLIEWCEDSNIKSKIRQSIPEDEIPFFVCC